MHRLCKWGLGTLCVLCVLAAGGLYWAGRYADSKVDTALSRAAARVPGLEMSNEFAKSGMLSREGTVYFNYRLPKSIPGAPGVLSAAVDYKIEAGMTGVHGTFERRIDYGNLPELLRSLNIPELNFYGSFEASLKEMGFKAEVTLDPVVMAIPEGSCRTGAGVVSVKTGNGRNFGVEVSLDGVSCRGEEIYSSRPSFEASLEKVTVKCAPEYSDGHVKLDGFEARAARMQAEASSIYLIGFRPDEQVRDPTLRERIDFTDLLFAASADAADSSGRTALSVKIGGNYGFAFPFIKEGQEQPAFVAERAVADISLQRVGLKALLAALSHGGEDQLKAVLGAFSDDLTVNCRSFGFTSAGDSLSVSGTTALHLNKDTAKPENIRLDYKLSAGQKLVDSMAGTQYADALRGLVESGAVTLSGGTYATSMQMNGSDLTLNGVSFSARDAESEAELEQYDENGEEITVEIN